ncbi:MAG: carbohydrate kinase family protein [Peptoniphilus sp.]|nr:carbohydrate kinase family protein [Peptoniphilus sp.]MDY3118691.1 carbohydrate kinase family protein [Peptoniphilus sp.]
MREKKVVVFGGCNVDISGRPQESLSLHDSNPGKVEMSPGGVGRNIAATVARLGIDTELITAFGDDEKREMIRARAPEHLSFEYAFTFPGKNTGSYLVLLDEDGEMHAAVNDMAVMEQLTPARVKDRRALAESADAVVVDANLREDTLAEIFSWDIRAVVDGVSAVKVKKFAPFLRRIHVLKCNVLEAQVLSGRGSEDIYTQGEALRAEGVTYVVITAGADGAYLFSEKDPIHFTSTPMAIRGATGAGDAFCAMLTAEMVKGKEMDHAVIGAMAASRMVLKSDQSELAIFRREDWEKEKQEIHL